VIVSERTLQELQRFIRMELPDLLHDDLMSHRLVKEADVDMTDDEFASWSTGKQKSTRISFATLELLRRVLTVKRRDLLKALAGAGPVSIWESARRVERDVKVEFLMQAA